MEFINRIELQGIVGSCRLADIQGKAVANFTVATNEIFKDATGAVIVETTWMGVSASSGKDISEEVLRKIAKGTRVNVTGKLKAVWRTDADGTSHTSYEVRARTVTIVSEE